MTRVKRVCRICGHDTRSMTACGMGVDRCDGHAARPDIPIANDLHDHCREGCQCTTKGCWAERVSLATGERV